MPQIDFTKVNGNIASHFLIIKNGYNAFKAASVADVVVAKSKTLTCMQQHQPWTQLTFHRRKTEHLWTERMQPAEPGN